MKAYKINDYEWLACPDDMSLEELEAWYLEVTGVDKEEGFDPPVVECPLSTKTMTDDTPDGKYVETTFQAVIDDYVSRNGEQPFLLACTEC